MAISTVKRNKVKGNGQKQLGSSFTVFLITDFCRKPQPSLSFLKILATI